VHPYLERDSRIFIPVFEMCRILTNLRSRADCNSQPLVFFLYLLSGKVHWRSYLHSLVNIRSVDVLYILTVAVKWLKLFRIREVPSSILGSQTSYSDWCQRHASAALYPWEKDPLYPLDKRLGSSQSWSGNRFEEKFFVSVGDRSPIVQFVVRHYTDWTATQLLIINE
jgi:uncharacterized RmlC-like cupin family protein